MSRYLVMRRLMTGSWEDCVGPDGRKSIEANSPAEAQEIVGDGIGVYRTIVDDPGVIVYVEVKYVAERSVSDVVPVASETPVPSIADSMRTPTREEWIEGERRSGREWDTPNAQPRIIDPPPSQRWPSLVPGVTPTSISGGPA